MKKCTYCGAEYSDDAVMCAVDHTPLDNPPPMLVRQHSGIGIASFFISIAVGCLMIVTLQATATLATHRIPGELMYPGQAVVGWMVIFLVAVDIVAIGLGIAALCQTERNRTFGTFGLVISSL